MTQERKVERDPLFGLPKEPTLRFKECLTNARLLSSIGFLVIVVMYFMDLGLWLSLVPFDHSVPIVVMGLGGALIVFGFLFLTQAAFPRYLKVPEALASVQKSLQIPLWLTVWAIIWGIALHFASQQVTNPLDAPWLLLQAAWAIPMFGAIYLTHNTVSSV